MNRTARHSRAMKLTLLLGWMTTWANGPSPVVAGEPLAAPFSELATRELRKQLKDKAIPFQHPAAIRPGGCY